LESLVFGARDTSASIETVEFEDDADSVQYVDPVSPSYKTSAYTEVDGETLPPYKLDSGDRIRVFVYGQPNLTRVYNVDGQGRISIPLIGSVLARGRTPRALEGIIKRSLQRELVKDAKVSIEIAVYRPIYVHGEVRTPGQFPYVYGMTVEAAIATAGGFSPRASRRKINVARTINGSRDELAVDLSSYVHPGDIISVDERFF
jgi:polysaccharide export outer membrane protein